MFLLNRVLFSVYSDAINASFSDKSMQVFISPTAFTDLTGNRVWAGC